MILVFSWNSWRMYKYLPPVRVPQLIFKFRLWRHLMDKLLKCRSWFVAAFSLRALKVGNDMWYFWLNKCKLEYFIYNSIVSRSVFTVFQKKTRHADLYSLPTKQGECQMMRPNKVNNLKCWRARKRQIIKSLVSIKVEEAWRLVPLLSNIFLLWFFLPVKHPSFKL